MTVFRLASRPLLGGALVAALGGCATLPSSGPTGRAIVRAEHQLGRFEIIPVDAQAVERLAQTPASGAGQLAALALPGEVDLIAPGDVLQVAVYEVGVALFGGRSAALDPFTSAAGSAEALPPLTVGRDGTVLIPWVGRVMAQGKTPDTLAEEIAQGYRGKSQSPQVLVSIRESAASSVIVQGDVAKPGRFRLSLARERLLDAIALAGGASKAGDDNLVLLSRGDRTAELPLGAITPGSPDDVALLPQDRVAVHYRPRSFTVLGASGRPAEVPFAAVRVSLAEALGRAGGANDAQADPGAVFVFRYEPAAYDGTPVPGARPIAYRLNLREAEGYFLAQRFEMRPRDVLYIANAEANLPTKAIQILNLFFSPFYTVRVLTQ